MCNVLVLLSLSSRYVTAPHSNALAFVTHLDKQLCSSLCHSVSLCRCRTGALHCPSSSCRPRRPTWSRCLGSHSSPRRRTGLPRSVGLLPCECSAARVRARPRGDERVLLQAAASLHSAAAGTVKALRSVGADARAVNKVGGKLQRSWPRH